MRLTVDLQPNFALNQPLSPFALAVIDLLDPEDDLGIDIAANEPRPLPEGDLAALNNSFGFGGHNVALVIKSY